MSDIYESASYQPRKAVGALLSRVRVEMLAALDAELAADKRLAPLEMSAAQFIVIANARRPAASRNRRPTCARASPTMPAR